MPSLNDIIGLGEVATEALGRPLMDDYRMAKQAQSLDKRAKIAAGAAILAGNKGNYGAAMPAIGEGVGAGEETYNKLVQLQQIQELKRATLQANMLKAKEMNDVRNQQLEINRQREEDLAGTRQQNADTREQGMIAAHQDRIDKLQASIQSSSDANEIKRLSLQMHQEQNAAMNELRKQTNSIASGNLEERRRHDLVSEGQKDRKVFVDKDGHEAILDIASGQVTTTSGVAQGKGGSKSSWKVTRDGDLLELAPGQAPKKYNLKPDEKLPVPGAGKGGMDLDSEITKMYKAAHNRARQAGGMTLAEFPDNPDAWITESKEGQEAWKELQAKTPTTATSTDPSKFKVPDGFGPVTITP